MRVSEGAGKRNEERRNDFERGKRKEMIFRQKKEKKT